MMFGRKKDMSGIDATGQASGDKLGAMLLTKGPQTIGPEDLRRATEILQKYKAGKKNLETRIIEDEKWYQVQHSQLLGAETDPSQPRPTSAWLFNTIMNKHADAMDNYPKPNALPREKSDTEAAKQLSSVVPCILEQNEFEQTYSDNWWEKLKHGTGVYFTGWDKDRENGLGDVTVAGLDLLNIYWEPGISNIQKSRNLFIVDLVDNEVLETEYPELQGESYRNNIDVAKYIYEDDVDTTNKSLVIDWYYHARSAAGQMVLHYVKYVGDRLLYATQNDPETADSGLYDHGEYPVDFDTMFPQKGSPVGFGLIAITRNPQMYIDQLGGNILKHSMMLTKPRYWCSKAAGVNKKQFLDWNEPIVDVEGQINSERLQQITVPNLDGTVVSVMQLKIDELKETSGNRDVNSGDTGSGITAAAAISALQEAGNKPSRDTIKTSYRCYTQINYKIIELVRQFYDVTRTFRITGDDTSGQGYEFMDFSNAGIKDLVTGVDEYGNETVRRPVFDIKISAEKKNPFSQMTQNEYAKEFYQMGLFSPERAQESVIALSMMDFEGKDKVLEQVKQGQTLLNICQQMQMEIKRSQLALSVATGQQQDDGTADGGSTGSSGGQYAGQTTGQTMGAKAIDAQKENMTGYQQKLAQRSKPDMAAENGV